MKEQLSEDNSIKNNINDMINCYFDSFMLKFEKYNKQTELAEILLSSYNLRLSKSISKLDAIDDFINFEEEERETIENNIDRLNRIESRISKLEVSSKNLLNKVSQLSLIKKA